MSQFIWPESLETGSAGAKNQVTEGASATFLSSLRMEDWQRRWTEPPEKPLGCFDPLPTGAPGRFDPQELVRGGGFGEYTPRSHSEFAPSEPDAAKISREQPPPTHTQLIDHESLTFGVPGHDAWSVMRSGDTLYEQVNRSFYGAYSPSAALGLPMIASQFMRNTEGMYGAEAALYKGLHGAIGSYSAYNAWRDAQHLMAAEGPWGYAKYSLAVAADLGMSAGAFAKVGGVGAKWAAPVMGLSFGARCLLSLMPDRTRSVDSP